MTVCGTWIRWGRRDVLDLDGGVVYMVVNLQQVKGKMEYDIAR